MAERAFVIQQIGAKESPERKRADEIYEYVIAPAVKAVGLAPYRADLDLSPGAITPRMLSELLDARVVIADLTGRNPNVFYELGITHSFARPLISIADSVRSLPFDTKDERVIELGEYPASGLPMARGLEARASLEASLKMVLADGYVPPSPLRELAANRSVDQLAPENPLAAEMAQVREALEEIRKNLKSRAVVPGSIRQDIASLRSVIEANISVLDDSDFEKFSQFDTSTEQDRWITQLRDKWSKLEDPWLVPAAPKQDEAPDEPPF